MPLDLTPLSAPFTKLVEVVARGIGTIYEPTGTVRQAKAEATAQLIRADADIKTHELMQRAAARLGHVEVARQKNIENVIAIAQTELPPEVSPKPVEQDWINHFFASIQDVSSEDLQKLWGKILAGEVAAPGRYTRRLIEFLRTIDRHEADMLTAVLSVTFKTREKWSFYFPGSATRTAMQTKVGKIDWETHLIDIGILSSQDSMPSVSSVNGLEISFGGTPYVMAGPPPPQTAPGRLPMIEMIVPMRMFTSIGQQLTYVASADCDQNLVTEISKELAKHKVSINPKQP